MGNYVEKPTRGSKEDRSAILKTKAIRSVDQHGEDHWLIYSTACYDEVFKEFFLVGGVMEDHGGELNEVSDIFHYRLDENKWNVMETDIPETKNGCLALIKTIEDGSRFLFCYGGYENRIDFHLTVRRYIRDFSDKRFYVYDFQKNQFRKISEPYNSPALVLADAAFVDLSDAEYFVVAGTDTVCSSSPRISHGNLFVKKFDPVDEVWDIKEILTSENESKKYIFSVTILEHYVYVLLGPSRIKPELLISEEMGVRENYRILQETKLKRYDMESKTWETVYDIPFSQFEFDQYSRFQVKGLRDRYLLFFRNFTLVKAMEDCIPEHKRTDLCVFDTHNKSWLHYKVELDLYMRFRPNRCIIADDHLCILGGRYIGRTHVPCCDIIRVDLNPIIEDFEDQNRFSDVRLQSLFIWLMDREKDELDMNNRVRIKCGDETNLIVNKILLCL